MRHAWFTLGLALLTAATAPAAPPVEAFPEATQFDEKPATLTHNDELLCVAYSPDGALVAAGGADKSVRLWHSASSKPAGALEGHTDAVSAVAFRRGAH